MTSSPAESTVSGWGITTWPSRRIPTMAASVGRPNSWISLSAAGEPLASVTSASFALPPSNDSRRTNDPTLTASSTRAVMRCGVETATSTPHI